jgi:hypothetical protein
MAKGALAKEPKNYKANEGLTRLSPGVYRNTKGQLVNYQGQAVKTGGQAKEAAKKAKGPNLQNTASNIYQQQAGYAQQFDPNTFLTQQQPQFNQSMNQAYNAIMNQFDLRNQRAFQQQKADLDQEAANKGWSPSGENYQRRYREMTDAQNQARQEAQNMAMGQATGLQQQQYAQATGTALLPGQIAGQFAMPLQQQYAKEMAALENQYRLQQIRATPRGGGAEPDYYGQYLLANMGSRYGDQGGSGGGLGQGFTAGLGAGLGQGLLDYMRTGRQ